MGHRGGGGIYSDNLFWKFYVVSYKKNLTVSHTHTHNTQPFYGSVEFVRENPGEPVPEETFTHYQLSPSSTIHGILPIQSTCSTVFFHNLSPSFLWSTSWPDSQSIFGKAVGKSIVEVLKNLSHKDNDFPVFSVACHICMSCLCYKRDVSLPLSIRLCRNIATKS